MCQVKKARKEGLKISQPHRKRPGGLEHDADVATTLEVKKQTLQRQHQQQEKVAYHLRQERSAACSAPQSQNLPLESVCPESG